MFTCMFVTSMSFCSSSGTKYPSNLGAIFVATAKNPIVIGSINLETNTHNLKCTVFDNTSSPNTDVENKKRTAMHQFKATLKEKSFKEGLAEGQTNIFATIYDADPTMYNPPYIAGIGFIQ